MMRRPGQVIHSLEVAMTLERVPVVGRVCLLVCVAAALAAPAAAQKPTFDIEGVVSDAQQGVLPGATGTLRNVATGLTREIATDSNGRYVFTSVPPAGQYVLQTSLAGFATERRENLTFNAAQRAVLNVTLRLSAVQETVTVAGAAPVVETTSAEVTRTIESRDLTTLPVAERNYFRLLTLDSNVVARGPGTNGLYVGGGDVWNFGTYVDGTSNFSKWLTLQRAPQRGSAGFALETVSQVQIITNQFSAEFGGHSAGVMNMITKSGSNTSPGAGVEHYHQERQQPLRRRGAARRPAGRSRCDPAACDAEGAVQPAAVRRQRRRPDS